MNLCCSSKWNWKYSRRVCLLEILANLVHSLPSLLILSYCAHCVKFIEHLLGGQSTVLPLTFVGLRARVLREAYMPYV